MFWGVLSALPDGVASLELLHDLDNGSGDDESGNSWMHILFLCLEWMHGKTDCLSRWQTLMVFVENKKTGAFSRPSSVGFIYKHNKEISREDLPISFVLCFS